MINLAWLVPVLPLIGFLINGLAGSRLPKSIIGIIGCITVFASFIITLMLFGQVRQAGFTPATVHLFDFISVASLHIPFDFQIDQLSVLFMLIITGVGFLIHLYSTAYMHDDEGYARYFAYMNLFIFFMLLLVMGANYVILFIGWEGVGLSSYLLIGFWFTNTAYNNAAKKAFIMNRIGDLGFLIGLFLMIKQFGSVNFSNVFSQAAGMSANSAVLVGITLLFFIGATGKSAQIPLYTWLPDAMAGPTPVSALIHAATMVTAGVYMIARSNILYTLSPTTQGVVAVIGVATAVWAASIALKQYDIKKVLAYSTVSQLGYMFLGLGVGAYTGAVFHVMTHAFFKGLLFLGAGSVIHAMGGEQDIRKMGGLRGKMKITNWTFLAASVAIAGIPPLSGFFSKDEILGAAFAQNPLLYIFGLLGALMTAFYIFRLYALTFLGKFRGTEEQEHHVHENSAAMTFPLVILAILSIVGGWIGIPELFMHGGDLISSYLAPVFAVSKSLSVQHETAVSTQWTLMIISTALVVVMAIWAWNRFSKKTDEQPTTALGKILNNKWYVDEIYDAIVVKPLKAISQFFNNIIEKSFIDGIVNGVGKTVQWSSQQIRLLQDGYVGFYLFAMVIGMIVLIFIGYFLL